jgi:hypothetical protein
MVVPIPRWRASRWAASKMRRFASLMPVMSRFSSYPFERSILYGHVRSGSSDVAEKNSRKVSIAILDATSPEACPPIPSATT